MSSLQRCESWQGTEQPVGLPPAVTTRFRSCPFRVAGTQTRPATPCRWAVRKPFLTYGLRTAIPSGILLGLSSILPGHPRRPTKGATVRASAAAHTGAAVRATQAPRR